MSFKEVKELRLEGKLDEALALANSDLEKDPTNVWNLRSISWVYYAYLKANANINDFNTFIDYADKIITLELPEDDLNMLHDNVAIQCAILIFSLNGENNLNYQKVNQLFHLVKKLKISKASSANTFIIKAFLKGANAWDNLFEFVDYFGFDRFQESDYKPEEYNGRSISSLVEKYFNAYSKKLIASANNPNTIKTDFALRVNAYLPILDDLISSHSNYQFLPYFKAKLLLLIGDNENVLTAFLPFAKRKKNDFWVWELIAEIFQKDEIKYFACLCKALSLNSPEEYIVGLRSKFAELLIAEEKYSEAKFEILKSIENREKKGWKIPNSLISLTNLPWFLSAKETTSNKTLYNEHISIAEALLFQDIEEEIIVVEYVNKEKQVLSFIKDESKNGFFSYKGQIKHPQIGDILKVRFDGNGKNGRFQTLSIVKDNNLISNALKPFKGNVKKEDTKAFAFVDNYFIEPNLVENNKLVHNQEVSGKVLLSFNKKKNQWGWKVISIMIN